MSEDLRNVILEISDLRRENAALREALAKAREYAATWMDWQAREACRQVIAVADAALQGHSACTSEPPAREETALDRRAKAIADKLDRLREGERDEDWDLWLDEAVTVIDMLRSRTTASATYVQELEARGRACANALGYLLEAIRADPKGLSAKMQEADDAGYALIEVLEEPGVAVRSALPSATNPAPDASAPANHVNGGTLTVHRACTSEPRCECGELWREAHKGKVHLSICPLHREDSSHG